MLGVVLMQRDLDSIAGLRSALESFAEKAPAVLQSICLQGSSALVKDLGRPGAWLLDTVYTMQGVMANQVGKHVQYVAVGNCRLSALAGLLFPGVGEQGLSKNNVGNHVEHLAWLALEGDRCDITLSLAWHVRQLEAGTRTGGMPRGVRRSV